MRAIYSRSLMPGSFVICALTWSKWSHCGVVTPDGTVIEAAAFHGVREISASEFLAGKTSTLIREIPVPDDAAAIAFARTQVGKPYDYLGVAGIGLHRDWQQDDRWFCSELVEAAAAAGGRPRFINDARRVTPQESWMVA